MRSLATACTALLLTSAALAEYATQSDWSGGDGVPGPLSQWDSTFSQSGVIVVADPGRLRLDMVPDLREHVLNAAPGPLSKAPMWGDIDLDGHLDFLAVSAEGDSVLWCRNPGDTLQLWTRHHIDVIPDLQGIALLPFGDGRTPGFVVNYHDNGQSLVDRYYHWEGNWSQQSLGSLGDPDYATGVTAADLDCSGVPEAIGWRWGYDEVVVWWNCQPGYGEVILDPHCPSDVFPFDGDGDGDCELAVDRSWYPQTDVYWNNGGSWSGPHMLPDFSYGYSHDADDLDGDGNKELTAISGGWQYLFWGGVSGWDGYVIGQDSDRCVFADLGDNADTDIVGHAGQTFHMFYSFDGGQSLYEVPAATGFWPNVLAFEDIHGDGSGDLVLTRFESGEIRCYEPDVIYKVEGWLESSILYLGCDPGWDQLDWTASTPPGTSVAFQVRSSDDPGDMGEWSDTLQTPGGLSGILEENDSYLQYRALLATSDQDTTPMLEEVTVSWDPQGTAHRGEALRGPAELFAVRPNPSRGGVTIRYRLAEASAVDLRIFDVSGRLVERTAWKHRPGGVQSYSVQGLPAGVYVCRLLSGGESSAQRFVILR
jgi:hypothetical protein